MTDIIKSPIESGVKDRAVTKNEVIFHLGISSATLYRLIKAGRFPKPMKFGYRMSRWLESDIQDYLDRKKTESRATGQYL